MREDELHVFGLKREDSIFVEQEVEINRARALGDEAFAPERPFDRLTGAEQGDGIQRRAQGDDLIEKARLIADVHRLSLVERGAAFQYPVVGQSPSRARKIGLPIAEV